MLHGTATEIRSTAALPHSQLVEPRWRTVDQALREIAVRRAALDAEEARWLREAESLQIWRPLGMVSALDYLERVLGYAPRTAQDRLRVARALGDLPRLTAALTAGALPFSAVRELTRVTTPATEKAWIDTAIGKSLRQIEELVADRKPGDNPDDPPDPQARRHVVRFELAAETFATLRQARQVLDDEHGSHLDDDAFVSALCGAVLDGAATTEPMGRAKFQIAVTVCERCRRGWQEGAGANVAIGAGAVERSMCDAQHIGSIDGAAPERAHQDIPPSVARLVWHRDHGRCRVPGCRSSRGLELHHLVHRADGGSHEPSNLVLACSACHQSHHEGRLTISGTADHLEVRRLTGEARERCARPDAHVGAPEVVARAGSVETEAVAGSNAGGRDVAGSNAGAHVGTAGGHDNAATLRAAATIASPGAHVGVASRLDQAILRAQAKEALTGLGWKPAIAAAAVAAAVAALGPEATLEQLIIESLRRCPVPRARARG